MVRALNAPRKALAKHTLCAYSRTTEALFVELPAFDRYRAHYLTDESFVSDLTAKERNVFKGMLKRELEVRR